jgi:hypothetical protein
MIIKHYSKKGCLEGIYWCVNSTNSLTDWIKELYVKFVLLITPILLVLFEEMLFFNHYWQGLYYWCINLSYGIMD